MPRREQHDAILQMVHQQTETSQALGDALAAERKALAANDLQPLTELAQQKQLLVSQLETVDKALRAQSAQAGLPVDGNTADFNRYCRQHGLTELETAWGNLQNVLKECRIQNQINGGAIEMSRRFSEQTLSLLRNSSDSVSTYGADGKASHSGVGISVARA